jgi:hypothetical protein
MPKIFSANASGSTTKTGGNVAVTRRADRDVPPPDHTGFEEVRRLGFQAMRDALAKRRKHK